MPLCNIVVRTLSFDPETAFGQVRDLVGEYSPRVIVGESWGANLALCIPDIPVLLVSPALGCPRYLCLASPLCKLGFIRKALENKYKAKNAGRQEVRFDPQLLAKWTYFRRLSISTSHPYVRAFFGSRDSFRRSGVVNINCFIRRYGKNYTVYDGSHWMEEAYVYSDLMPAIAALLR